METDRIPPADVPATVTGPDPRRTFRCCRGPTEHGVLIVQPVIARGRILGGKRRMCQETESSQPVVRRNDDDAGFFGQTCPLCEAKFADAEEGASVEPNDDGRQGLVVAGPSPRYSV